MFLQVFSVLFREGINVKMMSQGASKVNISLVVDSSIAVHAVQALHAEFFEQPGSNGSSHKGALPQAAANGKH